MTRRILVLALVLGLLSVACNSTNRLGVTTNRSIAAGLDGEGGNTGSSRGEDARSESGTRAKDGRTGGPSAAGNGAASGGSAASGSVGAPSVGAKAPIKVGFIVIKGGDALVTNALGLPVSFGDGRKQVDALVRDLNERGGINGRPMEPYYYEWNVADPNDSPAVGCVKLTEDDRVFAIITVVNIDENMVACAARHRTILVNASFGAGDSYYYQQFGDFFFSPSLLTLDRQKKLLLDSLRANSVFKPEAKVGILLDSTDPMYKRVSDTVIAPTLRGWKVPYQTFAFSSEADFSAAVLRFRNDGVNIVIFSSSSAIPPLLFMRQADSQGWAPRYYAMTDSDDSNTNGDYAPRSQTQKIIGVGALPISNVAVSEHPTSPVEERCLALMRKAGENDTNRRSSLTAEPYCEAVWEFEAVTKRVAGDITSDAWRAAFPTIGTSYTPVTAFSTDFGTGRHDNASAYRELFWKPECSCVSYRGPLRPIPLP
jgi:hypothetical protein